MVEKLKNLIHRYYDVLVYLVFGVLTALFLTISIISSVNAKKKAKIAA